MNIRRRTHQYAIDQWKTKTLFVVVNIYPSGDFELGQKSCEKGVDVERVTNDKEKALSYITRSFWLSLTFFF